MAFALSFVKYIWVGLLSMTYTFSKSFKSSAIELSQQRRLKGQNEHHLVHTSLPHWHPHGTRHNEDNFFP